MINISPSNLNGTIRIQPSKSVSHRAIICAALSKGTSKLSNIAYSDDILATLSAAEGMGLCSFETIDGNCVIKKHTGTQSNTIFCNESGSTLRFMAPLAMDGKERLFTGKGRLLERPQIAYEEICRKQNILWKQTQDGIVIKGELCPDIFIIRGDISSQFVSGLLFALPLLKGDSRIIFTSKLESKAYVDLTMEMQKEFGVHCEYINDDVIVYGNQQYKNHNIKIEGDYSHAAFFAVAAAIGGDITMLDLKKDSLQGDKQIFSILKSMGADVDGATVRKSSLTAMDIDVSQIPDLVPALSVLACAAKGTTTLFNAARLRIKESDRLFAMTTELTKLGANISEFEDKLVISGGRPLHGGIVDSHGDHRIAMALAIASCFSTGDISLNNPEVVKKSAPYFYNEFRNLGGIIR